MTTPGKKSRGRQYMRKFDYDEARERYAAGEAVASLAAAYGVSVTRIRHVVIPEEGDRASAKAKAWIASGVCTECGAPASRHNKEQQVLCWGCAGKKRVKRDENGNLYCPTCDQWKPESEFPVQTSRPFRGRHSECRPCGSARRARNREENRERDRVYDREYKRRKRAEKGR